MGQQSNLVRSNGQILFAAATALVGAGVVMAIGINAKHGGVAGYVAAALLLTAAIRAFFLVGVQIGQESIVIRGVLTTRRVAWSDIQGFSFGACSVFPNVGIATLRSGRKLPITAISTGTVTVPAIRANAEGLIARLNERLAEHQGVEAGG